MNYPFKLKPYEHQRQALERDYNKEAWGYFWEMGTGKSKIILDTVGLLFLEGKIDALVVITDKGVYRNWEWNEVPRHMPDSIRYRLAHWSATLNRSDKDRLKWVMSPKKGHLDILLVNVEAFSGARVMSTVEGFLKKHKAMMVVDESTSIKSPRAQRTKRIMKLRAMAPYRRILTGTPLTNGPLDVWSQMEFLRPCCLGFKTWTVFRAFFAILKLQQFGQSRAFYQVVGYKNSGMLSDRLAKHSSRVLKEDCLDLPPKIYSTRYVEHTPEQAKAYLQMKTFALAQLEKGRITASNALTILLNLQRINSGHVKLDSGEIVNLPCHKLDYLLELVEKEIPGNAIIWCRFQRDVQRITQMLREAGIPVVTYYGQDDSNQRKEALETFRSNGNCKLVGTPQTGGKGLTLVEASTTVYYSNGYKLEDRLQSEDRNHRIGQDKPVTYVDLVIPKTVDVKVLKALLEKKNMAETIVDKFKELFS